MFATRAASTLVKMKFWCCDARWELGLPLILPSLAKTRRHFSAVNQCSVAKGRTLRSQACIPGKAITLSVPEATALSAIGMTDFRLKPRYHDAMMEHA